MLQPLGPVNETSLVEAVYEAVLKAILVGNLPPHTIVSEVALSKQLQVSRTPVHDALRQLAKDGVMEQTPGRRARVAAFTRNDVFEIFELRKYLEGPAAEQAATRITPQQLQALSATSRELSLARGAPDWLARWADFDGTFHRVIAEASGNRRLAQDINRYRLLHRSFIRIHTDEASLQQALVEHNDILAALEARNGPAAGAAMIRHIATWQAYFVEHFQG